MQTTTADHRVDFDEATNVATLTLDRPQSHNALTADLLEALYASLVTLERSAGVRAIVVTGAGKGFCAGQALDDDRTLPRMGKHDLYRTVLERYNPFLLKLATIEKPVVAAVNGVAAGAGMGIALACDFRIASTAASFTTAFAKIGLVPDSGVSFFLPRVVGYGRALELAMLSARVDAHKALELGLVNSVVEHEALEREARTLAETLARGPRSLGFMKREFVRNGLGDLRDALAYEAEMQSIAGATADFAEGLDAFRAKRTPNFSGR